MAASDAVKDSRLIFTNEHTDPRTYQVSFNRINHELGSIFKPSWRLDNGGDQLYNYFKKINLTKEKFLGPYTNRLAALKEQILLGKINKEIERI